jgi:ribonuclease HII
MLLSFFKSNTVEAGCDEAGRGCLAGPVVAAAVILPQGYTHPILNDSKQLSHKQREILRIDIERDALAFAVAFVSPQEIDEINILKASFLAMHRALDTLSVQPELLLIDGNRFTPYGETPHECIIKGDGKYLSIAAASILAKTYRDEYMLAQHDLYPNYNWKNNQGYPTKQHRAAIAAHGTTPLHRLTFRLLAEEK